MDKELKAKWLMALRSNAYKQGRDRLRRIDNSFCCLGVLCDVSKMGEWEKEEWAFTDGSYSYCYKGVRSSTCLVPMLCDSIQISCDKTDVLIGLNDNGTSFREIADYIERNL